MLDNTTIERAGTNELPKGEGRSIELLITA